MASKKDKEFESIEDLVLGNGKTKDSTKAKKVSFHPHNEDIKKAKPVSKPKESSVADTEKNKKLAKKYKLYEYLMND